MACKHCFLEEHDGMPMCALINGPCMPDHEVDGIPACSQYKEED